MVRPPRLGTFSIVACDRHRQEWGVAVQSRFVAAGAVVPWAEARVGAVATQALANVQYGPGGLALLRNGASASEALAKLTDADPNREDRQVAIVDRNGGVAAFQGKGCPEWAGHQVGDGFACLGNTLFSAEVVRGMARTFESTPGDLPERLLAALSAGQREGGDRRGMQSAALLVVREGGGYLGGNDRWIDVRVDDHPTPIEELERVFKIYDVTLLARADPATLVPITPEVARTVQYELELLGFYHGRLTAAWDEATSSAFAKFLGENNFEGKTRTDGTIWPSVLEQLGVRANAELARRKTAAPIQPGALDRGPGAQAPPAGGVPSPPSPKPRKRSKSA
jgi:uncharacterized Ntn-hydrolase superfamily protein